MGVSRGYGSGDTAANQFNDASDVLYDNTVSGLTATDVKAALDELAASGGGGGVPEAIVAGSMEVRVLSTGQVEFPTLANDPTGGTVGQIYFNTTRNVLRQHNGTGWEDVRGDTTAAPTTPSTPFTPVQTSALATTSATSSITLTLANQVTEKNALVADVVYSVESSTYDPVTALTSAKRRVIIDLTDFGSLWQNTAGTTAVTAVGQTVRRIDNLGSLGGNFQNSTGWVLRYNEQDGIYLEANLTQPTSNDGGSIFSSVGFDWEDVIPVAGGVEVNWVGRATEFEDPGAGNYHYSRSAWVAGDACSGVTFQNATTGRAYNDDGSQDELAFTHVDDADEVISFVRTGGSIYGSVASDGSLGTGLTSGNPTGTTGVAFSIGGPYHLGGGTWPLFQGRFYGLVAGDALTQSERAALRGYLSSKVIPTQPSGTIVVTDNTGRQHTWISQDISNGTSFHLLRLMCLTAAPKEGPSTDDLTVTVNFGRNVSAKGFLYELEGLRGSQAWDANAGNSNTANATTGSMTVTGSALPAQNDNDVLSFLAVKNSNVSAGLALSGPTQVGVNQDATGGALLIGRTVISSTASQVINPTWTGGSAGDALGLITVLKRGTNTDTVPGFPPPVTGGGSGNAGGLSVSQILSDVTPQAITQHDYLPAVVPTDYDWYLGWRGDDGDADGAKDDPTSPNPPAGFSAQVVWGEFFTHTSTNPVSHNWGFEVVRLIGLALRNGVWEVETDEDQAAALQGFRVVNYNPQTEGPIETRVSAAGRLQVKMPSGVGSIYHFWTNPRTQIVGTGATHRAGILVAGLIVWDSGLSDDRLSNSAQRAIAHSGIDYWRTTSAPFLQDYSNNSDMGIGRGRVVGMIETPTVHTVTSFNYSTDTASATSLLEKLVQMGVVA